MMDASQRMAWLERRRRHITASDVAGILCLSKWETPLSIWQRKQEEPEDERPARLIFDLGHAWEPWAVQRWNERFAAAGHVARLWQGGLETHSDHECLAATPDASLHRGGDAETGRLEIKTSSGRSWRGPQNKIRPSWQVLCQVQHQLACAGMEEAWIYLLWLGGRPWDSAMGGELLPGPGKKDPYCEIRWYVPRMRHYLSVVVPYLVQWHRNHLADLNPPMPRLPAVVDAAMREAIASDMEEAGR